MGATSIPHAREAPGGRRWQWPRLDREQRWIGGVAAGLARELGVQPIVIRAAFVALATVGGWGLVMYAVMWVGFAFTTSRAGTEDYRPVPKASTPGHRLAGIGLVTLGLVLGFLPLTSSVFAVVVWPVGFVLSGMLVAWTRADDGGTIAVVRVVAGLVIAIGGFSAFVFTRVDLVDAVVALVLAGAVAVGIALVAAPTIVRMGRDLDRERLERTRSDERARVNAHLHDSVLQTLTLIQQESDDPTRTRRLARRQERELRSWLYGTSATTDSGLRLTPALELAAAEVEGDTDAIIDVVTVGDVDDVDDLAGVRLVPLISATREAMWNAVLHSRSARISVFAERTSDQLVVYVRDDGVGFDPARVGADRRGISESIVRRVQMAGGTATVRSEPGAGTEVELSIPISAQIGSAS
jgi:signal transduction histidine kinase